MKHYNIKTATNTSQYKGRISKAPEGFSKVKKTIDKRKRIK